MDVKSMAVCAAIALVIAAVVVYASNNIDFAEDLIG